MPMDRALPLAALGLLLATAAPAQTSRWELMGDVSYRGSFLGTRWIGVNPTLEGQVTWDEATGALAGRVCVETGRFDSGVRKRDEDARRVLEVDRYPRACFTPRALRSDGEAIAVEGELELHGVRHPIRCLGRRTPEMVDCRFRTRFSDWNLRRPRLLGLAVADEVEVQVRARLRRLD